MLQLNQFYIGEAVNFMKENIPDDFIDLTVTSPPYDNLRDYNNEVTTWNFEKFKEVAKELFRITKPGGVVVWVVGDATINGSETGTSFRQALYFKEIGFNLHDTMIYAKNNPMPIQHNRYQPCFEYMFIFSKGKPKTFNKLTEPCKNAGKKNTGTYRDIDGKMKRNSGFGKHIKDTKIKRNIWFYDVGYNNTTKDKYAHKHPAIFPEKLAEDHILSWSNEGDIILDPMCGSGTTCKMAWLNKRNFIGIDISEEYINDICKPRLKQYGWDESNLKLISKAKTLLWERRIDVAVSSHD